ncbi:MAG TPA: YCF48-related protein [Nannocystaceae bacterium]|nr:YCF48-related protein [Nannocystaceae bacterium]
MAFVRLAAYPLLLCATIVGCNKDDDDGDTSPSSSSGSSSTGSAWLVGDEGEMLRMSADGSVSTYPLAEDHDLVAIACVGTTGAWVVGSGGTVLSSSDAGTSWQHHDIGTSADLAAVAVAEDDDGNAKRIVVAGDGVLLQRIGDGAFTALGTTERSFTSVDFDHHGERLLAVADDGSIWRADGDALPIEVATFTDQPLYGVALDASGRNGVVVGAAGWVAMSADGGTTWQPQTVPTTRDLFAVRLSIHGDTVIAVGEAGTVVRIDDAGTSAHEWLDPALSLRGVHLHAEGNGHAVGDAGTVLVTADLGLHWEPVDVATDAVLRGVDDFHADPHL